MQGDRLDAWLRGSGLTAVTFRPVGRWMTSLGPWALE